MQLAEAFEPKRQVAEFVFPAKHTLNGVEPFLEDRRVEKWLAAAFGGFPVPGIRIDVRHRRKLSCPKFGNLGAMAVDMARGLDRGVDEPDAGDLAEHAVGDAIGERGVALDRRGAEVEPRPVGT